MSQDPGASVTQASQTVRSLRSAFKLLIDALPEEMIRTSAEAAKFLGVSSAIVQRTIRAVIKLEDEAAFLSTIPGVRGLRGLLDGARRQGVSESILSRAQRALNKYATLIESYGGSKSSLTDALDGVRATAGSAPDLEAARRDGFEAMRSLMGRSAGTQVTFSIWHPGEVEGQLLIESTRGFTNLVRSAGAVPFFLGSSLLTNRSEADDSPPPRHGLEFVEDLSTVGSSALVREEQTSRAIHYLDPSVEDAADVFVRDSFAIQREPLACTSLSVFGDGPAKDLVALVCVHASLAETAVADLGCYVLSARGPVNAPKLAPDGSVFMDSTTERWFDKTNSGHPIIYIGPGLTPIPADQFALLPRLVDDRFTALDLRRSEFIAYYFHVPYPIWGTQYLFTFGIAEPTP